MYTAVKAAFDASSELGKERIAIISADNLASITLVQRLGFVRIPARDLSPEDQVYVLQKPSKRGHRKQIVTNVTLRFS